MAKTRKNKILIGGGNYHTQTTVTVKNKDGVIDTFKLPEYKDNQQLYLSTYGLLKMPKGLDFGDELGNMVNNAYNSLNFDPTKYRFEPHVEFVPSYSNARYNMIFGKFRKFLTNHKTQIAEKLVSNKITTRTADYLTMTEVSPTDHTFALTNKEEKEEAKEEEKEKSIEELNIFFDYIKDVIMNDENELHTDLGIIYNATDITIDDSNINLWTDGEMRVIEKPENYENFIFIIGQVFGIIAPDFRGDLLTFDNDALNEMFAPQIFIDLYNKLPKAADESIIAP